MAKNGKLSARQNRAVTALLTSSTIRAAAQVAKVGYRTLNRWLAEDEDFKQALIDAEAEALAQAARAMSTGASRAVQTLLAVIDDPVATNSERIAAARSFLALLPNVRLLGSIEAKLAKLDLDGGNK